MPDLSKLIACPYCRATVTQSCRSRGGNPVVPHSCRLAPRLCPCGELLAPRKQWCTWCRRAARKVTYRLRERRVPTRERRAA